MGSPPHPRGILVVLLLFFVVLRITPASAGNTSELLISAIPSWDHPRIRGEYGRYEQSAWNVLGSPPHPRGIPGQAGDGQFGRGITPASAGNTY